MEEFVHRSGWDQPQHLATVMDLRLGALSMRPIPLEIEGPPSFFIEFVGDRFACGDSWSTAMVAELIKHSAEFFGFAFINELSRPSGYKARRVTIVDVYGRTHVVMRIGGQKPTQETMRVGGGRMVRGLYRMVLAVAASLPDNRCDREALSRMALLSPQEVQHIRERSQKTTPLPAPGQPVVSELTPWSARLTWPRPAGRVQVFRYVVKQFVDGAWQSYGSTPTNTFVVNLTPGGTRTFAVQAQALEGGELSPPATVTAPWY